MLKHGLITWTDARGRGRSLFREDTSLEEMVEAAEMVCGTGEAAKDSYRVFLDWPQEEEE